MLKTVEDISKTKKRLKIEIPAETIEKEIGSTLQRLRQEVKIPGFRQGKAPISLLEKRFGKKAEADALEKIISDSYSTALKEANITPVTNPVIEEGGEFKRKTPLSITLTVEVRPRLETLRYEGINVKDISVDVSNEDIEATLKRLQEEKAVYEPSDAGIMPGDITVFDIKTETFSLDDHMFKVGTEFFPSEFSEGLRDKRKGDEFSLNASFPEVFHIDELKGKSLALNVFIKEVKKPTLPSIDDELAKDIGFDSLDALKSHIFEELMRSKKDAVAKILKAEVLKKVIEENEFEVPESLLHTELMHLKERARLKGNLVDEVSDDELTSVAQRNIKALLIIDMIGDKEAITVSEDEIKKELKALSMRLRLSPENVIKYFVTRDGSLEGLRHSMFEEKVLNLLLEKAIIGKETE
ncbi:MAG: trigger factor [Nitrospirae bacterium]|nr:trigger factor [Nitrospirota bacterium]